MDNHFLLQGIFLTQGANLHPDPSSKATLWVKAQHEGALPPPCWARVGPAPPRHLHLQMAHSRARQAAVWGAPRDGEAGTELQREGVRLNLELQATEQREGPCSGEEQGDVHVGAGPEGL